MTATRRTGRSDTGDLLVGRQIVRRSLLAFADQSQQESEDRPPTVAPSGVPSGRRGDRETAGTSRRGNEVLRRRLAAAERLRVPDPRNPPRHKTAIVVVVRA